MVTLMGRKVLEKLNEHKGNALSRKMDEIDELLRPYTIVRDNGIEEVFIPNDEIALKYEKLDREFHEIIMEINLMDKN